MSDQLYRIKPLQWHAHSIWKEAADALYIEYYANDDSWGFSCHDADDFDIGQHHKCESLAAAKTAADQHWHKLITSELEPDAGGGNRGVDAVGIVTMPHADTSTNESASPGTSGTRTRL